MQRLSGLNPPLSLRSPYTVPGEDTSATKQSATLCAHSGSAREETHHPGTYILQKEFSAGSFLGCVCTVSKSVAHFRGRWCPCCSPQALCGGRTLLRYPAVLMTQVIRAILEKKDELAFFSSDDGDVMVW